jgi:iron-sulfur cluster assembly protein
MLEVTEEAQKEINSYFEDKDPSPIRIYLESGGCSGPRLVLALDEKTDDDEVLEVEGQTYLVEKALLEEATPIKVEMSYMGFQITSSLALEEMAGGGCGGCGGGCS